MSKPHLDTYVALYDAAVDHAAAGHRAMQRVIVDAERHGYSRDDIICRVRKSSVRPRTRTDS